MSRKSTTSAVDQSVLHWEGVLVLHLDVWCCTLIGGSRARVTIWL